MKIVLDTNVLVSGLLSPFGSPAQIVRMVVSGYIQLCYDARIAAEYRQVLNRPRFGFDPANVAIVLEQIESSGEVYTAPPLKRDLPDRGDNPFLEVAIAAGADFLVTGNTKHYPPERRMNMNVITPSEFLRAFGAGKDT
jgi:putative PIN family toxin of toxin-antitoxin system